MSTLEQLKRKRTAIKGSLTRFATFLDKISNENEALQLESRLKRLSSTLTEFEDVQLQIESLDIREESTAENDAERDSFETKLYSLEARAKQILKGFIGHTNNNGEQVRSPDSTPVEVINNIKLPTINLPRFDGSYNQWLYFKDTFLSIIHENTTLNNIQKFHYLRLSLTGEAAETVRSLEISSDNYSNAWQLLVERYENKNLLVNNHVKAVFNLPSVSKESCVGLRSLVDNLTKHLRSLETLGLPVASWDILIIYMVSNKLDPLTRREWEKQNTSTNELPKLNDFKKFLIEKCNLLETLSSNASSSNTNTKFKSFVSSDQHNIKCRFCLGQHYISNCQKLLNLTVENRYNQIKTKGLCSNCLKYGHTNSACTSSNCKKCGKRHHTLLHFDNKNNSSDSTKSDNAELQPKIDEQKSVTDVCTHAQTLTNQTLLSTAIVQVRDGSGQYHNCRALLDSGSTVHLISENMVNKLKLQKVKTDISVSGLNQSMNNLMYYSNFSIRSSSNSFQTKITCFVINRITDNLPSASFDCSLLKIPNNLALADPEFNVSNKIDLLIGAEIFWRLIQDGQIQLNNSKLILHNTLLGWIISGPVPNLDLNRFPQQCNFISTECIDKKLTQFWEVEEYGDKMPLNSEELAAEAHFKNHTTRDSNGRFIVKLPLKQPRTMLGESKETSIKRFLSLEQKLNANSELKHRYVNFMNEYITLNHMTKITDTDKKADNSISYYIPHHFVRKDSSLTTKLRVVFDASAKTTSNYSLNDIQMVGPTIQQDLISIVLRFRSHKFILVGDITKMYRQVLIHPDDRDLQRIVWRCSPQDSIDTYELNTVTYGTSSAPFLAVRCLQEIAYQNETLFPHASKVILNDFYVDDLLTGANDSKHLISLYHDISTILSSAGFSLNKWISNDPNIINHIQSSQSNVIINIGSEEETHSLGLLWHSNSDTLKYQTKFPKQLKPVTKRLILSTVASIHDPLGLIGPCIIKGKLMLQKLWQQKLEWDERLPSMLEDEWETFSKQIPILNEIQIPRFVLSESPTHIELHGFADSSEHAYGACVYVRSIDETGEIQINLLTAKSKVAPLKSLTIPRLELCACVLLSRLVNKIKCSWQLAFSKMYFWSDSKIALAWIQSDPKRWKIFVANRVSEIQNLTNQEEWYHVNSHENPADIISRGLEPSDLKNCLLWWCGPQWLRSPIDKWPNKQEFIQIPNECREEIKTVSNPVLTLNSNTLNIFERFSTFSRLQRVTAYILRFKNNCLHNAKSKGPLTCLELNISTTRLIRLVQQASYGSEISLLSNGSNIDRNSKLLSLNPFIDQENLLRVGGRLGLSNFNMNKKYPIILPGKHKFTELLIKHEHFQLLHAGPQSVLASFRESYWIVSARNAIRKVIRNCIICFKTNPKPNLDYLMGELPPERTTPNKPFLNVAVDYCGPFNLRDRQTRNYKITKAYVCVFVCMSTKAIHIELVSNLTTKAFIACLRRFIARRGKCLNIYSDNGTNFVGAQRELKTFLKTSKVDIETDMAQNQIIWHFQPPKSPHFGGLHEAGVKSVKYHLKRVVGTSNLTFEEFATVLCQVEACLNSRPLYPLSSDPNDPNPLTPAHFLIGQPLRALSEEEDIPKISTSRYQQCQQMVHDLWRRWSKEYISELQVRRKWKTQAKNLMKGDLVVIKEDNYPVLKWHLGRVIQLHPGHDGITRVATIKTPDGIFKRSVSRLCVLPSEI